MKNAHLLFALTICLVGVIFLSCETSNNGDENEPFEEQTMTMTADKESYYPFDIVKLDVSATLDAEQYEGKCGTEKIAAVKLEEDEAGYPLMFVVPNVLGKQKVTLTINGQMAKTEIFIQELPQVSNPTEIINNLKTEINSVIANLDNLSDTLLTVENRELIGDMVNEFNSILAQMSAEDKALFARYYNRHAAEYLNEEDDIQQAGLKSTTDDEFVNLPQIENLLTEKRYLVKQIVLIGTLGYAFHCLLTVPDPTFFTKLAAIADGVILIERVVNFKSRIVKLVNEPNIPIEYWDGNPNYSPSNNVSNVLKSPTAYDFDIENYGEVHIPFSILFRTMYSEDANSVEYGSPLGQLTVAIVQSVKKFQNTWDEAERLINKVKSLFGFRGNLSGKPQRLEQVNNYKTEEVLLVNYWHLIFTGPYVHTEGDIEAPPVASLSESKDYIRTNFAHTYNVHTNNLNEHYAVGSFHIRYNLEFYEKGSHRGTCVYAISPQYTVRVHCPDRNPPK